MPISYDYFPAAMEVLDLIGQGLTTSRACDKVGITTATFKKYINSSPDLQDLLVDAEARSHDAMVDALVQIDSHPIYGSSDAGMASVISKNIQFLVSRRDRRRYGDKVEHIHNITADRAIIDALNAGKLRASQPAPLIEGVLHEITTDQNPQLDLATLPPPRDQQD